jgi:HlyD family secretion protein
MHITRTQWVAVAVVVAVGAAIAYAARPKPLTVDAAPVVRGALETTIDADGRTRVRDRYVVTAPVAGRVERITRTEGEIVRAGDVIVRIAPIPLDSVSMAQARLGVEAAEAVVLQAAAQERVAAAELEQTRRNLTRSRRLFEVGAIAPRVLEESELATTQAEEAARAATERCRAARADAAQARATLAGQQRSAGTTLIVRAPAAGRVLRVPERSERVVVAGTPLIEIGDPGSLEIVIDVLSSDGAMVHPGDSVRLSEWTGLAVGEEGRVTSGRVREIEPSGFTKVSALGVEEQRVNVIVDPLSRPSTIGDGFRVEASIVVWSAADVIRVPRSALLRDARNGGQTARWRAYVIREGHAELRDLRIGHAGSVDAEVLAGLAEGDRVIVFPSDQVKAGSRVVSRKT